VPDRTSTHDEDAAPPWEVLYGTVPDVADSEGLGLDEWTAAVFDSADEDDEDPDGDGLGLFEPIEDPEPDVLVRPRVLRRPAPADDADPVEPADPAIAPSWALTEDAPDDDAPDDDGLVIWDVEAMTAPTDADDPEPADWIA
jgi:hypothetical protein